MFVVDGFPHVRCEDCRSLFVSRLPTDEEMNETYLDPAYHEFDEVAVERMRAEARARARVMKDRGCTRVLEVGCGAGFFIEALLELGIEAVGVDPGPQAKGAAERGLPVLPIWLHDHEPSAPYDGVAMFELLEHLPNPIDALTWLHEWTTPNATLAMSTPSASGVPARLLGRRFPMLCPPNHLELYTRRGIDQLLRRGGFIPFRVDSFSNLDEAAIGRSLQRYLLGDSALAEQIATRLARFGVMPAQALDRMGLGISFEVYAQRR